MGKKIPNNVWVSNLVLSKADLYFCLWILWDTQVFTTDFHLIESFLREFPTNYI